MSVNMEFYHSLAVDTELCVGCAHCIRRCPTKALRIRAGKATIRKNWCVDCGECLKVCPVGAIYVEQDDFGRIFDYKCRVALYPSAFLAQFPETEADEDIFAALGSLGFTHTYPVELTAGIIEKEMAADVASAEGKPLISSLCPSVVRLIQTKFPDLVDHIMTVRTPVETTAMLIRRSLAAEGYAASDIGIFYVTPCAAKAASIKGCNDELVDGVLNLNSLYNKVCHILSNKQAVVGKSVPSGIPSISRSDIRWSATGGEASKFTGRCFAVDGIFNVIEFIERLGTSGEIYDIDFLELRACDRSCMGGSLTPTNRFLADERLRNRAASHPETVDAMLPENMESISMNLRTEKPSPMTKLVYKGGIQEVLNGMSEAQKIHDMLPGIDCGACGSPTCKSFAQDIVRGEARLGNCVFVQIVSDRSADDDPAVKIMEELWGGERFRKASKN